MTAGDPTVAPGELTVDIADRAVRIVVEGAAEFTLPIGPVALFDGPLERSDLPSPVQLTNALGLVQDHLDDVIIAAPAIMTASSVLAVGAHAVELARVEIGSRDVPGAYALQRSDADEVFRTLALEPAIERRHNPGLDPTHVDSIVGTCCVILGIMRRLDLSQIVIAGPPEAAKMP